MLEVITYVTHSEGLFDDLINKVRTEHNLHNQTVLLGFFQANRANPLRRSCLPLLPFVSELTGMSDKTNYTELHQPQLV